MNANDPAHPVLSDHMRDGLTKREAFAMAAMQGMRAYSHPAHNSAESIAEQAVRDADALLARLEKQP